jgi:hypothetical protein
MFAGTSFLATHAHAVKPLCAEQRACIAAVATDTAVRPVGEFLLESPLRPPFRTLLLDIPSEPSGVSAACEVLNYSGYDAVACDIFVPLSYNTRGECVVRLPRLGDAVFVPPGRRVIQGIPLPPEGAWLPIMVMGIIDIAALPHEEGLELTFAMMPRTSRSHVLDGGFAVGRGLVYNYTLIPAPSPKL